MAIRRCRGSRHGPRSRLLVCSSGARRNPSWSPWTIAAGAAALWTSLAVLFSRSAEAAPPVAPPPAVPKLITDNPIALVPGTMYAGAIVVHGGANFAGHGDVVSAAGSAGFVGVTAAAKPIAGWPWNVTDADWYVVGRYTGAPRTQARHEGRFGGSGDVVEAFAAV